MAIFDSLKTSPPYAQLAISVALVVGTIAVITDLWRGRIYNWLTAPTLVAGLIAQLVIAGAPGLSSGLLGAACALLLLGVLFLFGGLGGGDVKLLMALSAWQTPRFAWESGMTAILAGGVMAAIVLLVQGRLPDFLRRMYGPLRAFLLRELEPERPRVDKSSRFPFGIAIVVGVMTTYLSDGRGVLRWLSW